MTARPRARVDHLLVAVPDLGAAIAAWSAAGFVPQAGGRHPGGTINALVRGPEPAYVEIISADIADGDATTQRIAALHGPVAWAIGVRNIRSARSRLESLGTVPGPIRRGSRTTPSGDVLRWQVCDIADQPIDPVLPFLIQWDVPMKSGPDRGPVIRRLTVGCPHVGKVAQLLAACGLEHLDAHAPGEAALTDGNVVVVLSSEGHGIISVSVEASDFLTSPIVIDGLQIQPAAD